MHAGNARAALRTPGWRLIVGQICPTLNEWMKPAELPRRLRRLAARRDLDFEITEGKNQYEGRRLPAGDKSWGGVRQT